MEFCSESLGLSENQGSPIRACRSFGKTIIVGKLRVDVCMMYDDACMMCDDVCVMYECMMM